jgi:hypothetical protein
MAESDRQRLLERALALREAGDTDFYGGRTRPPDAAPSLIKIIEDTSLRTKLLDARLAEGLQSPKGPQKIASIVRIYPDFDAPARGSTRGAARGPASARARTPVAAQPRGLPTVEEMERLIARIREIEANVESELSAQIDDRIDRLKRSLADLSGPELEGAVRELSAALDDRRALASQIRHETFKRVERDGSFAPRAFLRLLAR